MKKQLLALTGALYTLLLVSSSAVELPSNLTPLHHWDAYNPNGDGTQPTDGSVISNLVDLAGGNTAGLIAGAPIWMAGDLSSIGGQPTIRFVPADGLLATNAITDQSVTIFSVSKLNGGQNRRLITGQNPSNYLLGYWNNGEHRAFNGVFFGSNQAASTNQHMYIHQALDDGTDILQDADAVIPNTDGAGASLPIGPLGFGGINWSVGESSNGDISEIIIFDSDMSAGDFQAVGLYLSEKYGFTAFGHDGTVLGGGPTGPTAFTWTNGSGDNQWTNPVNWFGGVVPGLNDTALIGTNATPSTIDLTGAQPVRGVSFRPGATGFTLANGSLTAGRIIHIGGGTNEIGSAVSGVDEILASGGTLILSGGLNLDRPLRIVGANGTLRVNSVLSGASPLTKSNASTLELQAANTFSGALNVTEGTLRIAADGALGDPSGVTTIASGALLTLADGLVYNAAEPIALTGTLTTDGTATLGSAAAVTLIECPTLLANAGNQLRVLADLAFTCLNVTGVGEVELVGTLSSLPGTNRLGLLEGQATGLYPLEAAGTNFTAFIENDGLHSWLLIGRGREGWEFDADGQGAITNVIQHLGTTNAFPPAAYSAAIINDLLDQSGLEMTDVEIRIKRALDPAGTSYQEARWQLTTLSDWDWRFENTYPTEHRILSGNASPFHFPTSNTRDTGGTANDTERIFTWAWNNHGFMKGFSYGGAVTNGTNNLTSFLWENGDENHALPYTELYIRSNKSEGLYKTGSGTLVLRGTNTYDTLTFVDEGLLEVRSADALGSTAANTRVGPDGAVHFGGGLTQTSTENLEVSYLGGTVGNSDGNNQFDGTVSVTGEVRVAVGQFSGGDVGEGLDLDGDFLYAVNVRGPGGLPVRDALFTDEAGAPNVVVTAVNEALNWQNPQFGNSTNDDNLEIVMQSIRWHPFPRSMTVDIAGLTPGSVYKIQLLFYEPNLNNRGFDMYLDRIDTANLIADDFTASQGGAGVVASLVVTASQPSHTLILLGGDAPFGDRNPVLQAITVEQNVLPTAFPGRARIEADAGSLTLAGPVTPGNSLLELGGAGELFIPADLTGGPDGGLHKTGTGLATLSGDNAGWQGDILVDDGTLLISTDTALGDGGETRVTPAGTLALSGNISIANERFDLAGAGAIENAGGNNTLAATSSITTGGFDDIGLRSSAGTLVVDALIDLGYASLLVDGNGDTLFNSSIGSTIFPEPIGFVDAMLDANPIAYYTFDTLLSTNSYANDGSLTNSVEILGAATITNGLHGNGVAIADDSNGIVEVNFPGTTTANPVPLPGDGNYTIGGWFNGLHETGFRTFSRASTGDHQALIENNSNRLGMFQGSFFYSGYNTDGSAGPPIDARTGWHFLVVVGHADNTTDYYIDNTYVGSVPRTSRSNIWRIGAWPGQTFADLIDDFFVFDRALDPVDIDTLWRANTGLAPSNRVIKAGTGTLTLAGENDYRDGTSVLGGTLSVDNLSGSGTGTNTVIVGTGATLAGDGRIGGSVEINAGGTLSPGGLPGDLEVTGGVQLNDPAIVFAIDLLGPTLNPLAYDRVIAGGDVAVNGVLFLTRDAGYTPNNTESLVIATGNTLSGTFAGVNEGAIVRDNFNTEYTISYLGNAVTLTPVDLPPFAFGVNTITYAPGPGANQGSVTLSWASTVGTSYRIESAPHPEGPWTPLTTGIAGQAGMTMQTAVVNNVDGVQRLYLRVGVE